MSTKTPRRRWGCVALLVVALAFPPQAARGQAAAKDAVAPEVRALFLEGRSEFDLGHIREALVIFEKAYKKQNVPLILYNIAQCHRRLGDLDAAKLTYESYLLRDPKGPAAKPAAENLVEVKKAIEARSRAASKVDSPSSQEARTAEKALAQALQPGKGPAAPDPAGARPVAAEPAAAPLAVAAEPARAGGKAEGPAAPAQGAPAASRSPDAQAVPAPAVAPLASTAAPSSAAGEAPPPAAPGPAAPAPKVAASAADTPPPAASRPLPSRPAAATALLPGDGSVRADRGPPGATTALRPAPAERAAPLRFVAGGAALAAAIAGGYFYAGAKRDASSIEGTIHSRADLQALGNSVRSKSNLGVALFGAAGALAVASAVFFSVRF
jgi:hypothetical protein